jgi:PAS domain S-box-containing protein
MARSVKREADTEPCTNRPRILLAEPEVNFRHYLTGLLGEEYEIDSAPDPSTALTLAHERAPDLIVANAEIQKLPGFDRLGEFRRDEWGKTPIVLYSTACDETASDNASETEPNYGVITPFSDRHLLALIRTHLRVAQVSRASIQSFRSSEERSRTLRTMITPCVWVAAPNGEITDDFAWWWEKRTGQKPEQYMGHGWLDVVHPDDRRHVLEIRQAAIRNKTTYQIEARIRQHDGSYRYMRSQGAPVCDDHGDVRQWIGTIFDIDDRKRTEEALRLSEERHRTFIAMTTSAVWTTNPHGEHGKTLYGWDDMTGQTPDDYQTAMGWLEALHPDDKPRVTEIWQHALQTGTPIDTEFRVRQKDGTYGYVHDQGVPLRNPDGTIREWVGTLVDIDERKQAEEALRLSEERYRVLTTTTSAAVWTAAPDGRIIGDCPGWESITGQTPEQYRGWGWANVVHPDDKQQMLENWNYSLQHTVPVDVTYRNRRRDGSYGYFRAQGAPICNPDGSVREWIGTVVDIDDQKRAEEAMRLSEAEFRANFEMAGIGQVQTDPKTGRYLRVNSRFCEMVGYSAAELLTMTFLDITHPDDRAASMQHLLELLRNGVDKLSVEKRYIRKDGSIVWGRVTSTLVHDEHLRPLRTITMIENVTERKQSEALSLCQKKALEMVAQGSSLCEVLDSLILAVEKQATVELRASIQILDENGMRFRTCCAPSFPESYRQAVANCRVDLHDLPCTLALFLKEPVIIPDLTREPKWADVARVVEPYSVRSIWTAPIISAEQKPLGTFCFYSCRERTPGATEQAMIESVLQTIALVIERAEAESQREQLLLREKAAREQAEAASRVKDEFLAVVSHELRAPLNAINGWTFMLLRGTMDRPSQMRALESIQRQIRSQCQLIDDLLDVARIVSGKLRLEMSNIDPSRVIHAALDVVRPAAEAKEIDLVAKLDPSMKLLWADSDRLQQVIWNLLSNAIKFTPSGGRVEIRSRRANSTDEIVVSDTGQGISEDFLPYIFDRFRQADSSTTRTHEGIGLGLAIVRHLIELHGGIVFAESAGKGKGTTFTIRLPLRTARRQKAEVAGRKRGAQTVPLVPAEEGEILKGIRVLLVDDSAEDRDVLVAELTHLGATVCASGSVNEALIKLEKFQPDVLVADIAMPDEDGYSLIRKIRGRPADQRNLTPAIALTAYAGDANRKRVLEAGFHKHMSKPADPTELARTIVDLATRNAA